MIVAAENLPQNGTNPLKSENFIRFKHSAWGVYPEAMDWNLDAMHSDFNVGELIWAESPKPSCIVAFKKKGLFWRFFGISVEISSSDLKSECTAPKFQSLASG